MLSSEAIERAVKSYSEGCTLLAVAADLAVCKSEARRVLVAAGAAIRRRGFAAMDATKRRAIAIKGGAAVPAACRFYAQNRELAATAGSIGGMVKHHGIAEEGHRQSNMTEYRIWRGMLHRCHNPDHVSYPRYGGRGIAVCQRWLTFDGFLADMGSRPDGLSIDRIDNDGNYEPGNCRWATPAQQQNNTSTTIFLSAFGERRPVTEWARLSGLPSAIIRDRHHRGWASEDAVSVPLQARGGNNRGAR